MLSKKLFSKALNAVSILALGGALLGSACTNSALAMDLPEDEKKYDTRLALSQSSFKELDPEIVHYIMANSIDKDKVSLALTSKYFLEFYGGVYGKPSLEKSSLKQLDDSFFLGPVWRIILNDSLGDNKQHPIHIVSRHFHALSCHPTFNRTLVIKTPEQLKEILSSRNPSREKDFKIGKFTIGHLLPYPPIMCLNLGCRGITPNLKANDLGTFLGKYTLLTSLDLKDSCVKGKRTKALEQFLTNTVYLKNLNLEGNMLFEEECTHLAQGLSHNSSLTSLKLDHSPSISTLVDAVSNHPTLKSLFIKGCYLNAIIIMKDFLEKCPSLTSFHIVQSDCKFSEPLRAVGDTIATHSSLKELGLLSVRVPSKSLEILRDAIGKNSSLAVVDLTGTALDPVGKQIIMDTCKTKNIHLKWDNTMIAKLPSDTVEDGTLGDIVSVRPRHLQGFSLSGSIDYTPRKLR